MNTKIVTFPFYFRYPANGEYREANAITLCEPNYDNRSVYRQMCAYVAEAQKGILRAFSDDDIKAKAEENATSEAEKKNADFDAFQTMSLGLGLEIFPGFCEWLQKAITNKPSLAYVGDDPANKVAVTEEVWRNVAEQGGMERVEHTLSQFAGFFFKSTASSDQTKTGSVVLSGPPAQATARSRSQKQ